jgi:hypothetical protein
MKPLGKNMQLCSKYRVAQSRPTLCDREYFTYIYIYIYIYIYKKEEEEEMKYTIKHAGEAHLMFVLIKNVHLVANKWVCCYTSFI